MDPDEQDSNSHLPLPPLHLLTLHTHIQCYPPFWLAFAKQSFCSSHLGPVFEGQGDVLPDEL
jgi:hypothetical protein